MAGWVLGCALVWVICVCMVLVFLPAPRLWGDGRPKAAEPPMLLLLPLRGRLEDAERLLREAAALLEGRRRGQLLLLDLGMEPETREVCRMFCRDFPLAGLVEKRQVCDIIELYAKTEQPAGK